MSTVECVNTLKYDVMNTVFLGLVGKRIEKRNGDEDSEEMEGCPKKKSQINEVLNDLENDNNTMITGVSIKGEV